MHEQNQWCSILHPSKHCDDYYQRAFVNMRGTIAQFEADMINERVRSGIEAAKQAGKHTGRLPFGFDVNSGYLTPNEDYDTAVEVLDRSRKARVSAR